MFYNILSRIIGNNQSFLQNKKQKPGAKSKNLNFQQN